ncbi:MAG TPA: septal ring lytic transglycosylase RlpA family protein [Paucimonas sp.]|nr:septal ring lytic transglycosylase RlpA family protein [Paucimonas sp.]
MGLVLPPPAVADSNPNTPRATSPAKKLDRSGKPRTGKASYYGRYFHGKTMADGTPMNPNAAIAASRTLPLGTVAKVTNLENGESAVVEIRDRGPYVDGRIIDLSPRIARQLGFVEQGIAAVEVQPLELPPADETVASNTYTSEK